MATDSKKETYRELKYAERILKEYKRYDDADGFVRLLTDGAPDVAKVLGRFADNGRRVYQIELDGNEIRLAEMLERQKILDREYVHVSDVEPEQFEHNPIFKVLRIERAHHLVAFKPTEVGMRMAKACAIQAKQVE